MFQVSSQFHLDLASIGCVPCPKFCAVSYHDLPMGRCFSNYSHQHILGVVGQPKKQSSSGDDIVGDNSN